MPHCILLANGLVWVFRNVSVDVTGCIVECDLLCIFNMVPKVICVTCNAVIRRYETAEILLFVALGNIVSLFNMALRMRKNDSFSK